MNKLHKYQCDSMIIVGAYVTDALSDLKKGGHLWYSHKERVRDFSKSKYAQEMLDLFKKGYKHYSYDFQYDRSDFRIHIEHIS